MQSRNTENTVLLLNKWQHFLQILKTIHFLGGSTETKVNFIHKDDNLPGTQRSSKLFFYVNIYLHEIIQ